MSQMKNTRKQGIKGQYQKTKNSLVVREKIEKEHKGN
jgi:hypothetical protein